MPAPMCVLEGQRAGKHTIEHVGTMLVAPRKSLGRGEVMISAHLCRPKGSMCHSLSGTVPSRWNKQAGVSGTLKKCRGRVGAGRGGISLTF